MEKVSIDRLRTHFNLRTLMELFKLDWVLKKIKHLRFFVMGEEREIIKESDDNIWYMSEHPLGIGIIKVKLNEDTVSAFEILKTEFFKLLGIEQKTNRSKPKSKRNTSDMLIVTIMLGALTSIVGWKGYDKFK